MVRRGFDDDLSSISCVSHQLSLPSLPAEENKIRSNTDNLDVYAASNSGSHHGEKFENEFQMQSSSSPPLLMNGNETPPTELLLPKSRLRRIHGRPSWWSGYIPSFLKQYPPILRVLFVACFVCILCAAALLVFAFVSQTKANGKESTLVTDRNFGLGDLPQQELTPVGAPSSSAGSTNRNNDIFVGDREDVVYGEEAATSPTPTQGKTPTVAHSDTSAPTPIPDTGEMQQSSPSSPTLYPSVSIYPQISGKEKKMAMRIGRGKLRRSDKDDKDDDDSRRRKRKRRQRQR
mmetsp:Transcript_8035/g.16094  ORF Transcript_8035/g.16094 Transcript_8035/m.16094 type:complete len:290 (+) Transcript_8035:26-895(+)